MCCSEPFFSSKKSHPCQRRDDILLRNGLPALVRCTFSKIMLDAHFWPLQIVALVGAAWTIFHVPKLASQKCARRSRKTYTFKNMLMSSTLKIFTLMLGGAKKCLWRDSRAYFSDPRPRPLVPMSLKLLHDLCLLGQASLKLQGHLHFVNQDHFWSFFTPLNQDSLPYIRKTTLF